ncbi:glycosyltransferase family 4 protein [Pseudanabaenaceae cyanobacterium LEGE 13415]|nr:glycosyltransferase family 4 protein [Pseudanabaenaceae cyanobacterium LEGE 13415]
MKILHVCAIGLTAKNLLKTQINYFLSQGASVEIACAPDAEVEELRHQGYKIHTFAIERRIASINNLISIRQMAQLMRSQQYDIVHVHTPIAAVLGRIAAKLAGVRSIVYTAHGFPFHDRSSALEYWMYSTIERLGAPLTDLILTQNQEDVVTSQKLKLCSADQIAYLGNGIDLDRFDRTRLNPQHQSELRCSIGIPDTAELIIGTVGRLTYKKGSSYLIEAAAQLLPQFPNLHILVVGGQLDSDPEPFHTQLVKRIHQLGLSNHVTLTGNRDDIPEMLGLMDIFTLPTFTHEGLPRSILEAMAMQLPVVTTFIRGCREAVVSGKTGFVVAPQDSRSLAEALELLMQNAELRQKQGQAGRLRVEAHYDERFVFQRLTEFYNKLYTQEQQAQTTSTAFES